LKFNKKEERRKD